jgi:hypothetical protein
MKPDIIFEYHADPESEHSLLEVHFKKFCGYDQEILRSAQDDNTIEGIRVKKWRFAIPSKIITNRHFFAPVTIKSHLIPNEVRDLLLPLKIISIFFYHLQNINYQELYFFHDILNKIPGHR